LGPFVFFRLTSAADAAAGVAGGCWLVDLIFSGVSLPDIMQQMYEII